MCKFCNYLPALPGWTAPPFAATPPWRSASSSETTKTSRRCQPCAGRAISCCWGERCCVPRLGSCLLGKLLGIRSSKNLLWQSTMFLHRPSTGYKTMQGADWARADALLDCLVVATTFMIFHVAYIYIYTIVGYSRCGLCLDKLWFQPLVCDIGVMSEILSGRMWGTKQGQQVLTVETGGEYGLHHTLSLHT